MSSLDLKPQFLQKNDRWMDVKVKHPSIPFFRKSSNLQEKVCNSVAKYSFFYTFDNIH